MFKSLYLGRIFGIATYIHWTFWILLLWVSLREMMNGGLADGLLSTAFFLSIFICVYLHELGHALAAHQFGVRTLDITLLPIGGLARLERMPGGFDEVLVALAGPAVNAVISAVLLVILLVGNNLESASSLSDTEPWKLGFVLQLLFVNLTLIAFNLIPAFPMDGGRVLRGFLTVSLGNLRATEIAARIGRTLSLLMVVVGIFTSWSLVLLGGFVFLAGFAELLEARRRALGDQGFFQSATNPWQANPSSEVIDADDVRNLDSHYPS